MSLLLLLLPSFMQDFLRAVIGAALYTITSLVCVIRGAGDGALIAGGVSFLSPVLTTLNQRG